MERVLLELRLNPNLLFYPHKEEVGKELNKYFSDWEIINGLALNLYNKEDKTSCILEHNRIVLANEYTQTEQNFFMLVNNVLNIYKSKIEINDIFRIGIRYTILSKTSFKFSELVSIFQEKFYPKNKDIEKILVSKFTDVAFLADFIKNGYKFHYMIGPVNKEEGLQRFSSKFKIKNSDFSDTMLFVDVDGYVDERFTIKKLADNINGIKESARKITKESLKLFGL